MRDRFGQCARAPGLAGCALWGHFRGPDLLRLRAAWRYSLVVPGRFPPHGGEWVAADGSTVTYFVTVDPTPVTFPHVVLLPADQQTAYAAPPDSASTAPENGDLADQQTTDQDSDPPPKLAAIPPEVQKQADTGGMVCRRQRVDVWADESSDEATGPMICRGVDGNEYLAQDASNAQAGSTG
jgi:hypothetical protein